jgi:hypothetical protein
MIVNTMAILNQYGGGLVNELKQALSSKSATGKTVQSLQYQVRREGNKDILTVTGRPYIMALETGRKATPQYTKPSFAFVQNIREWLSAKGSDQGLAYAIAKSIHKKGTVGTHGIISNPVNHAVEQIKQETVKQFAKQFLFHMVEFLQRGNNNSSSVRT